MPHGRIDPPGDRAALEARLSAITLRAPPARRSPSRLMPDLPAEDPVFGYFDGHGWNMAFDHEQGVLNGVYDFADAAIGPVSREFTYSNLTAPDLTNRMIPIYEALSGRRIDRRTVALRTSVQHLRCSPTSTIDIDVFAAARSGRWINQRRGVAGTSA